MDIAPTLPARFLLAENKEKKIPPGTITRDLDNQDLIELIIAYGVQPVFAEADNNAIWVHFLPEEIKEFEDVYVSNQTLLITAVQLAYAKQWWRDLIRIWRSKMRYNDKMRVTVQDNGNK